MRTDVIRSAAGAALFIAAVTLALVGCRKPDTRVERKDPSLAPVKVDTVSIVERNVPRVIALTGTLVAELRAELTANSSGRVVKTFVERGQKVTQGTVLAQLDVRAAAASAAEAQANVASAKTQLEAASAECERYDALIAGGAITQQEHDRQTANCKQQMAATVASEARATSASIVVGGGTIRAPFAGVITERMVSVGDYVTPSSKVASIVVSSPLRLRLTVPEHRIANVGLGAVVTFSSVALPERVFSGTIKYIGGEVRPSTRDVVVEAVVQNADGALLPGMFVDASLRAGDNSRPVVPLSAVFAMGSEKSVYVAKSGHLEQRIVRIGVQAGEFAAVEEGVKAGEFVVVNPPSANSDGAPIL